MNQFQKIKDFYLRHKAIITILISMVLMFVSSFWFPLTFVLLVFLVFSYVIATPTEAISYTVFFLMFSGFILILGVTLAGTLLIFFVRYIIDVIKKRVEVYKMPLILTSVLAVIGIIVSLFFKNFDFAQGAVLLALLFFVYVAFAYRKQIDAKRCCDFLLLGMFAASIMSALFYLIPVCKTLVYNNATIQMMNIKNTMFYDDGSYKRLVMLSFHINHLALFCIFAVSYVCYLIVNEKVKSTREKVFYIASLILSLIWGFMTLSKSFIVLAVLIALYMIVFVIKRFKVKSLYFILPIFVLCVGVSFVFKEKILHVLSRFVAYDGSFLNMITTGRLDIWKDFIKDMFSNPIKIMFGAGLLFPNVNPIGTHSIYLFTLYRFGIVGMALVVWLIFSCVKSVSGKITTSFKEVLPILVCFVFALQETCIDERLILLILSMFLSLKTTHKLEIKNEK